MIFLAYRLTLIPTAACLASLSVAEQAYSQTLSKKRCHEFVSGRALVRQLVSAAGFRPAEVSISLPADHAPQLYLDKQPLSLSISHSRNAICAAIAQEPIGVDLELCRPRDFSALGNQYFALESCRSEREFYQLWTACEAYSKYSGKRLWSVLQQALPTDISFRYFSLAENLLCLCSRTADTEIKNLGELL